MGSAPAVSNVCFAPAVPDGHSNGSPSAPLGSKLDPMGRRLVGMASAEMAKVAATAATVRVKCMIEGRSQGKNSKL